MSDSKDPRIAAFQALPYERQHEVVAEYAKKHFAAFKRGESINVHADDADYHELMIAFARDEMSKEEGPRFTLAEFDAMPQWRQRAFALEWDRIGRLHPGARVPVSGPEDQAFVDRMESIVRLAKAN